MFLTRINDRRGFSNFLHGVSVRLWDSERAHAIQRLDEKTEKQGLSVFAEYDKFWLV